ncbi:unnamed protein product [Symbiodinium natans]|uniref:Uncharacterized protein n=1 Tax=Symbiodinium natans TaxID=878477 RepID=A0A812I3K9_9DINO|nr:unnamed protein product [Symbiodinium natans]
MLLLAAFLVAETMAVPLANQAEPQTFSEVFCAESPWMCSDTIDCRKPDGEIPSPEEVIQELAALVEKVTKEPNTPNRRSWCFTNSAYWDRVVRKCIVEGDLKAAAHEQFRWSVLMHPLDEMDASYCFLMGLCQNEEVTESTTPEEAVEICNRRFPEPGGWQSVGFHNAPTTVLDFNPRSVDTYTHFNTTEQVESYLKLACAQGNYHCDVMYCKETYCKTDYYYQKYKHYLPSPP